jgi:hypothetical protein
VTDPLASDDRPGPARQPADGPDVRGADAAAVVVTLTAGGPAGPIQVPLAAGQAATFGRQVDPGARPEDVPHLGLSANPRLHAVAGLVAADASGWTLANRGRWLRLRVTEQGGRNRLELDPGRTARVPYPRARIEVATGDEVVGLDVECTVLAPPGPAAAVPALSGSTVGGLGLDREAGYFRAVVALCEPRLRDPQSTEVATIYQIVRTLNRSGREPDPVTAKAVERRLAHVRRKLTVGGVDADGISAAGLEARDASRQLADLVIRTGTVGPADLALLAPAGGKDGP